jgi:hypothetical protein
MKITIDINEEQAKLLELILLQIRPNPLIVAPSVKTKKLSRTDVALQNIREYRLNKELKKRR